MNEEHNYGEELWESNLPTLRVEFEAIDSDGEKVSDWESVTCEEEDYGCSEYWGVNGSDGKGICDDNAREFADNLINDLKDEGMTHIKVWIDGELYYEQDNF